MGNVIKTLIFLVLFWFLFLLALPIAVSIVEIEVGIQRFPPQLAVASLLLGVFTLLSLWAALYLAVAGRGTPAAFAPPREFVINGPYAYVRHPFVIASIGQGVGIGIAMGSIPVMFYVAALTTVYYFLVRPSEERTLEQRHGDAARAYSRNVRGFRPRLTPYKISRID